jgi:hypothetical protein
MAGLAGLARILLLVGAAGGENRLWFVDLELRGSCAEVRIDCGPDGETRFVGPFAEGENRRLSVPVPVRHVPGADLSSVPLPRALVLPAGAAATAQVLGWSALQPALDLERHAGALRARPRPALSSALPRAAWPELVLVGIAGGFLLRLRRRLLFCLPLAACAGIACLVLARSRHADTHAETVLEWEAGSTLALSVTVAPDELALPREWLEVTPEGRRLEFELSGAGAGFARARGARLTALESAGIPPLQPGKNEAQALVECWTRTAAGEWSARGSWARGAPMGSRRAGDSGDPPGWLASALPPGRSALVGRTEAGDWLRCLGFPVE